MERLTSMGNTNLMVNSSVNWKGPYNLWPNEDGKWVLEDVASCPGVYLFTVKIAGAYRVLYVGEAYDVAGRIRAHIRSYFAGEYQLYDGESLARGERVLVRGPTRNSERLLMDLTTFYSQVLSTLKPMRIFFVPMERDKSLLRRLESSLIRQFRQQEITSKFLENCRTSVGVRSSPIKVVVSAEATILGLPDELSF